MEGVTSTATAPAVVPDSEWELLFEVVSGAGGVSELEQACDTGDGCAPSCASSCISFS